MKITLTNLIKTIEEGTYLQDMDVVQAADFNKDLSSYAEQLLKPVSVAVKADKLIQTQLVVEGPHPVTFTLETNVINLPFSNYKKIANFVDNEALLPVNLYLETSSDYINVSKFRIDLLASADELDSDFAFSQRLVQLMQEKIATINENAKQAK